MSWCCDQLQRRETPESGHKNPTASIEFQRTWLGTKPAPVVAPYSSKGPYQSYQDILKPDVMAPGTLVLASSIPHKSTARIGPNINLTSDFALVSGTSLACPHVSGIVALLKGAHPKWSPAAIRSAIMTTANLNYPSFIALFSSKEQRRKLTKTLRCVGKDVPVTYRLNLEEPKGTEIKIWPTTLFFGKKNENQSYFMTIVYEAFNDSSSYARHGSLTWVDESEKHTVRSPIVVCSKIE